MDFEDIVSDDSSSSSNESVTQPLGKYYCSKRCRIYKYLFPCPQFLDLHKVTAAPPPTELKYPTVVMRSH